ncbi:hypothetical protein AZE42_13227 [Rhizopogon vesiculosus]|uniref:Uncharacterized protein n=1 Tax=Rhizopogon vesiculosus TaxID=180088 RepID=A0A1J8R3B4_9AGAM|nr:hypothetical protein AZE42_13227 [Rhizopogon vesiculosus]
MPDIHSMLLPISPIPNHPIQHGPTVRELTPPLLERRGLLANLRDGKSITQTRPTPPRE